MFDGELERPLANMLGAMTKYFVLSIGLSGPPMNHSMSAWLPRYQLGNTTTLSRAAFGVP